MDTIPYSKFCIPNSILYRFVDDQAHEPEKDGAVEEVLPHREKEGNGGDGIEEECADAERLHDHFEFAGVFSLNDRAVESLAEICARDEDEVDGDHKDDKVPVEVAGDDDCGGRGDEELVRERVKELAKVGHEVARACERTVDSVREGREEKERQGDGIILHQEKIGNKGDARKSQPRDDVRRDPVGNKPEQGFAEDLVGCCKFVVVHM